MVTTAFHAIVTILENNTTVSTNGSLLNICLLIGVSLSLFSIFLAINNLKLR